MSLESVSSMRLIAWKIAEGFKTLPEDVFEDSTKIDDQKKKKKWWWWWWWEDEMHVVDKTPALGSPGNLFRIRIAFRRS